MLMMIMLMIVMMIRRICYIVQSNHTIQSPNNNHDSLIEWRFQTLRDQEDNRKIE